MTLSERAIFIILAVSFLVIGTVVSECKADDTHRLYLGLGLTHLSNVDAGPGYNDHREDSVDHFGVDLEYQYHQPDYYLFGSFGLGESIVRTEYQQGWECGGCKYHSQIRMGIKWRIDN